MIIKAKEDMTDQYGEIRIIEGHEYELIKEFEASYSLIDETKKVTNMLKEHFEDLEK